MPARPFVLFRADAGPAMGGGHVQRCLALADAFSKAEWRCAFAFRAGALETVPALKSSSYDLLVLSGRAEDERAELAAHWPSGCDLLIVDHYGRGRGFESSCRSLAGRIMALDDLPTRAHDCDLLLDPTPGRRAAEYEPLVPPGCALLLGGDYALLRGQFAEQRSSALARRAHGEAPKRMLVSIGMTDPHNLTAIALRGIADSGLSLSVDVVLGSVVPHIAAVRELIATLALDAHVHVDVADMAALMSAADLAIGASGASSFERCCLGLPSLIVVAADNQSQLADALIAAGAVERIGDRDGLRTEQVAAALKTLVTDAARRKEMSRRAAALCDGQGAPRVVARCVAALRVAVMKTASL